MQGSGSTRFQFGTVTLIPDERLVLKDGRALSFTPKAFDLLAVLAANPGRLLTKDHLMQAVWPDTAVEESNLAYHVFAIRKALGETPDGDRYIETVPKRGYRFVAPVMRVDAESRALSPGLESSADTVDLRQATDVPAGPTEGERAAHDPIEQRARISVRLGLGLAAGLAFGGLLYAGLGQLRNPPIPTDAVRFQDPVTGRLAETGMFSVSPDGRQLVFAAEGTDGVMRLWARAMHTLEPVALPGTEVFTIIPPVVWSPDSRFVAFDPGGVLRKVSLDGGAPQTVCELPGTAVGGSWSREGEILLGNAFGGLIRCPASGGPATIVTMPDRDAQAVHLFPSFLSDGRRFIYLSMSRARPETSGIYAGELGALSPPAGNRLITTGFGATFVAGGGSGPGAIVFARDGSLFAQRFDERRLELIDNPVHLADRVGSYLDGAFFSVSPSTLVYRGPEPDSQLTWFDRQGQEVGRVGTPARFSSLALSPDGDRAIVARRAPQGTANQDLWLFDFARTAAARRLTFEPTMEVWPVWLTNDQFAFGSGGGASGVYRQTIGGQPQLLFKSGRPEHPTSVTADGRILLYTTLAEKRTAGDVWVRMGEGASATVRPFLQHENDQWQAQLSPDQRWVAYVSNEAGPAEVFVTEFRFDLAAASVAAGDSIRISEEGGVAPRWRRDSRELYYLAPDGSVMAIEVDTKREFRPGTAQRLFKMPGVIPEWGVTHDGARFLFAVPLEPPPPFNVVRDWQATLFR